MRPGVQISRRSLLAGPLAAPTRAAVADVPIERLVISRATFGWTPQLESEVVAMGWSAWLDQQLDPTSIPDPKLDALLADYRTLLNTNRANNAIIHTEELGYDLVMNELRHATFLRAVYSKRQLYEVMVDFWNTHFTVFLEDTGYDEMHTTDVRTVARAHALGKFTDLLVASAHSPAMLIYLDNARSNANDPDGVNENYGRELLELHSLGIIEGEKIYEETDVVAVAKVLSGWTVNTANLLHVFRFEPSFHFTGPVSLLGGEWSTPGHSGAVDAQQDGEDLLLFLAHHPSTARYIAWKLCKRFVQDDPPDDLVASAAAVFLANDTAIAPVLRHIFDSDAFAASGGAKFRRGFEFAAGLCRVTDAGVDPEPLGDAAYYLHGQWPAQFLDAFGELAALGQRMFGHRTPDGYSDDGVDWLSADALLRRWEWASILAHDTQAPAISVALRALFPNPLPPTAGRLLDATAARLLGLAEPLPAHGFADVPVGIWYESGVRWAKAEGLVTGFPDATYRAKDVVNRGQVAMMLWQAAGAPTGSPPHGFSDVPANAWFNPGLDWAKEEGLVSGFPGGTYHPKDPVNRGQIAMMLWQSAGAPTGSPPHGFSDVPASAWYGDGLDWAKHEGLVSGFPDGTYHPKDPVNRGQIAMMLFRLHADLPTLLEDDERAALLQFMGGEDAAVDEAYVTAKGPDIVALLLSTPGVQQR